MHPPPRPQSNGKAKRDNTPPCTPRNPRAPEALGITFERKECHSNSASNCYRGQLRSRYPGEEPAWANMNPVDGRAA